MKIQNNALSIQQPSSPLPVFINIIFSTYLRTRFRWPNKLFVNTSRPLWRLSIKPVEYQNIVALAQLGFKREFVATNLQQGSFCFALSCLCKTLPSWQ